MRRNWIITGILELAAGGLAILGSIVAFDTHSVRSVALGIGFILSVIGAVVLIHGLRADTCARGQCVICGRHIQSGSMYCRRCNPK